MGIDVELLDLVVAHRHEPDQVAAGLGDRGGGQPGRDAATEIGEPSMGRQLVGDVAEVAVAPASVPQHRDGLDVVPVRGSKPAVMVASLV
jgi:hypothetical protein